MDAAVFPIDVDPNQGGFSPYMEQIAVCFSIQKSPQAPQVHCRHKMEYDNGWESNERLQRVVIYFSTTGTGSSFSDMKKYPREFGWRPTSTMVFEETSTSLCPKG